MAERAKTDAAATTLLGEVTPVLSRLAERVEALQQPQSELLQKLRDSPLMVRLHWPTWRQQSGRSQPTTRSS